jgi:SAM-dependent methyltransferase
MRNHDQVIAEQFGSTTAAYLTSAVHAQGADLQDIAACAKQYAQALILDMGCGGGHASFAVAPHARQVIAYDLSAGMLDVVRQAAVGLKQGSGVSGDLQDSRPPDSRRHDKALALGSRGGEEGLQQRGTVEKFAFRPLMELGMPLYPADETAALPAYGLDCVILGSGFDQYISAEAVYALMVNGDDASAGDPLKPTT